MWLKICGYVLSGGKIHGFCYNPYVERHPYDRCFFCLCSLFLSYPPRYYYSNYASCGSDMRDRCSQCWIPCTILIQPVAGTPKMHEQPRRTAPCWAEARLLPEAPSFREVFGQPVARFGTKAWLIHVLIAMDLECLCLMLELPESTYAFHDRVNEDAVSVHDVHEADPWLHVQTLSPSKRWHEKHRGFQSKPTCPRHPNTPHGV